MVLIFIKNVTLEMLEALVKVEEIEWIRLLCLPYWLPYGCFGNHETRAKFVITLTFRCNIFQILSWNQCVGTTQEKQRLLKDFRAVQNGYSYDFNSGISRRNTGRFQYLKRLGSRNEIWQNGLFAYMKRTRMPTY
jgi:hypothetical protein